MATLMLNSSKLLTFYENLSLYQKDRKTGWSYAEHHLRNFDHKWTSLISSPLLLCSELWSILLLLQKCYAYQVTSILSNNYPLDPSPLNICLNWMTHFLRNDFIGWKRWSVCECESESELVRLVSAVSHWPETLEFHGSDMVLCQFLLNVVYFNLKNFR